MSTLAWIVAASLLGVCAQCHGRGFCGTQRSHRMDSHAGQLCHRRHAGGSVSRILPHAFKAASSVENMGCDRAIRYFVFFVLEKLVLWRHCHGDECEIHAPHEDLHSHGHDHGRSGMMIMVGDTFHNFVDGILIAAAFMIDIKLGAVTAMAIIAHEIPQEVGDFLILLHSGYTKKQSLFFTCFKPGHSDWWTDCLFCFANAAELDSSHSGLGRGKHVVCSSCRLDSRTA